jgi:hypothetical protein
MQRFLAIASAICALLLAPVPAHADCKDCGTVAEVRSIKEDPKNDASTAAAVKAGAKYQVVIKMETGKPRHFTFIAPPEYKVGDKVKIVQGFKLQKQ